MNRFRRVVLVYKKSLREEDLLQGRSLNVRDPFIREDLRRLRDSQKAHVRILKTVEQILRSERIPIKAIYRARRLSYKPDDFVIAVGGDGTFLEAARRVTNQWILGINSDPKRSVGTFCRVTLDTLRKTVQECVAGHPRIESLHRLELLRNGQLMHVRILNEILVTHRKPAAMSRYWIHVGRVKEEQRSSGLWVSTAAGSTGAIRSAGGRKVSWSSRAIQYQPRELYQGHGEIYRLRGGVLQSPRALQIGSLMRDGLICLDGERLTVPFRYGDVVRVVRSPHPLQLIQRMAG